MTTTHIYPLETAEGHKQKTPIFSMDNIPVSASKENLELFRSASVRRQLSHRETYSHSGFTAQQFNHYSSPSPFGTPPPDDPSHIWRTSIFDRYQEDPDSHTPASQPISNGRQPAATESKDSRSETNTPTHTTNQCNHSDDDDS